MSTQRVAARVRKASWRRWGLSVALVVGLLLFFLPELPDAYQDLRGDLSLQVTDRHGQPLRSVLSQRQGTDRWVGLDEIPQVLIDAVVWSEDRRFYQHPGLDPIAIFRALKDNIRAGTVVSGASTLNQQLLRTLGRPSQRSWLDKLEEGYWALRLEARYSKKEILEAYLNRVALGPTIYGVDEASRYYFDQPPQSLSLSEAAMLAVLIRAPSSFDPFSDTGQEELKIWTKQLLARMVAHRVVSKEAAERAAEERWELSDLPAPFEAPHFCDFVMPSLQNLRGGRRTSLDLDLQRNVEAMITNHLQLLKGHRVGNAAVVVADVESGEILALAGSADFGRAKDGQHNAATSLRQPGSTLKPFTYSLLLESVGHPASILPDLPLYATSHEPSFIPENYDGRFHGPVSIRSALGCSYNVPAVRALEQVGVEQLLRRLRQLGMVHLDQSPEYYGLGLTLGDGSVSLLELVTAYRALARGGRWSPLVGIPAAPGSFKPKDPEVFDSRIAFLLTDVMSDRRARFASFGTPNALEFAFPCAVKTGTSKGYRDNWCVGYTPKHVVGVWVGNSDGSPMLDVSGIAGAGPLFRDVMLSLGDGGDFARPEGLEQIEFCTLSGKLAGPDCPQKRLDWCLNDFKETPCTACVLTTAGPGGAAQLRFSLEPIYRQWAEENGLLLVENPGHTTGRFRLVFPLDGDVFLKDPDLQPSHQKVKFKAVGGKAPYTWSVDGRDVQNSDDLDMWWPLQSGRHDVKIRDATGALDGISVRVVGKS